MKIIDSVKVIGISIALMTGLAACDKPGPAETAGKKIDQSMDRASERIGEAADKFGEKIDQQSARASMAIEDGEITAKVKTAIFAEPGMNSLQINVETVSGVVTLSGSVDTLANSDRAKTLASAVTGVKDVENRLVIKAKK